MEKKEYDISVKYIVDKYHLTDIDDYVKKTIRYFAVLKELSKHKATHYGSITAISSKAFDLMFQLEEYKPDALSAGRKFYRKFKKMDTYEKRIIAYCLKIKGFEKSESLLLGDEEDLESAVEKCLEEYSLKKEKTAKKEKSYDQILRDW